MTDKEKARTELEAAMALLIASSIRNEPTQEKIALVMDTMDVYVRLCVEEMIEEKVSYFEKLLGRARSETVGKLLSDLAEIDRGAVKTWVCREWPEANIGAYQ